MVSLLVLVSILLSGVDYSMGPEVRSAQVRSYEARAQCRNVGVPYKRASRRSISIIVIVIIVVI